MIKVQEEKGPTEAGFYFDPVRSRREKMEAGRRMTELAYCADTGEEQRQHLHLDRRADRL